MSKYSKSYQCGLWYYYRFIFSMYLPSLVNLFYKIRKWWGAKVAVLGHFPFFHKFRKIHFFPIFNGDIVFELCGYLVDPYQSIHAWFCRNIPIHFWIMNFATPAAECSPGCHSRPFNRLSLQGCTVPIYCTPHMKLICIISWQWDLYNELSYSRLVALVSTL